MRLTQQQLEIAVDEYAKRTRGRKGKFSQVARELGVSRQTLYSRVEKLIESGQQSRLYVIVSEHFIKFGIEKVSWIIEAKQIVKSVPFKCEVMEPFEFEKLGAWNVMRKLRTKFAGFEMLNDWYAVECLGGAIDMMRHEGIK